jgi:hypothetical protein
MKGLDPAAQHFRRAGNRCYVEYVKAMLAEEDGRAAAGDQLPPHVNQGAGEIRQAGFIVYGKYSALCHDGTLSLAELFAKMDLTAEGTEDAEKRGEREGEKERV